MLEAWFLHEKLALNLLSDSDRFALTNQMPAPGHPFAEMVRNELFEKALVEYLSTENRYVLPFYSKAQPNLDL